jgi:hypothetical protein
LAILREELRAWTEIPWRKRFFEEIGMRCGDDYSGTRRMFEIDEAIWDVGKYYRPLH